MDTTHIDLESDTEDGVPVIRAKVATQHTAGLIEHIRKHTAEPFSVTVNAGSDGAFSYDLFVVHRVSGQVFTSFRMTP